MSEILLNVKNLKKYFKTNAGMLHAVDDVSFSIEQGHTMGVVGESGCGLSYHSHSVSLFYGSGRRVRMRKIHTWKNAASAL